MFQAEEKNIFNWFEFNSCERRRILFQSKKFVVKCISCKFVLCSKKNLNLCVRTNHKFPIRTGSKSQPRFLRTDFVILLCDVIEFLGYLSLSCTAWWMRDIFFLQHNISMFLLLSWILPSLEINALSFVSYDGNFKVCAYSVAWLCRYNGLMRTNCIGENFSFSSNSNIELLKYCFKEVSVVKPKSTSWEQQEK